MEGSLRAPIDLPCAMERKDAGLKAPRHAGPSLPT
jgi:hypothetical protein